MTATVNDSIRSFPQDMNLTVHVHLPPYTHHPSFPQPHSPYLAGGDHQYHIPEDNDDDHDDNNHNGDENTDSFLPGLLLFTLLICLFLGLLWRIHNDHTTTKNHYNHRHKRPQSVWKRLPPPKNNNNNNNDKDDNK
jgi:hypothetical protein